MTQGKKKSGDESGGKRRRPFCHPDEASIASGWSWLLASGQRGASAAGSGSASLHPIRIKPKRDFKDRYRLR